MEEAPNERLSGRLISIKPAEAEENAEKLHDFAGLTWLEVGIIRTRVDH
jgi:hypothetical protein